MRYSGDWVLASLGTTSDVISKSFISYFKLISFFTPLGTTSGLGSGISGNCRSSRFFNHLRKRSDGETLRVFRIPHFFWVWCDRRARWVLKILPGQCSQGKTINLNTTEANENGFLNRYLLNHGRDYIWAKFIHYLELTWFLWRKNRKNHVFNFQQ